VRGLGQKTSVSLNSRLQINEEEEESMPVARLYSPTGPCLRLGFGVSGLGFRVWDLGFGVEGSS
jgi:hypothetical protein